MPAETVNSKELLRQPLIPSRVLSMFLFVFVELMFFSALFSAYFVIKRGSNWVLPGPGLLPQMASGFNTLVLLMSGASMFFAQRAFSKGKDLAAFRGHALRAIALGVLFAGFQFYFGYQMISEGLTMRSSIFGACYFLLLGVHQLHVLFGLGFLVSIYLQVRETTAASVVQGALIFWLFVVCVWPVIYGEIYF